MSGVREEAVTDAEAGARLDRWIKRRASLTQGEVEKLLRTGQVRVDGARAKANQRLETGQVVRLPPSVSTAGAAKSAAKAQSVSERDSRFIRDLVIHDDKDMVVINKPAGLAVREGQGRGATSTACSMPWARVSTARVWSTGSTRKPLACLSLRRRRHLRPGSGRCSEGAHSRKCTGQ